MNLIHWKNVSRIYFKAFFHSVIASKFQNHKEKASNTLKMIEYVLQENTVKKT